MRYEFWTENQELSTDAFANVYSITGSKKLIHEMVWNLNRNDVIVKLVVDDEIYFEFDLESLAKDYKFDTGRHEAGFSFGIQEYDDDRWVYKPAYPIEISFYFNVEMKATKDNTKLYRGITGWRKR